MLNFILFSNSLTFTDYPRAWQLSFQKPATTMMEGIIDLHHDIFTFLVIIFVFVSFMLGTILVRYPARFKVSVSGLPYAKFISGHGITHNTTLEIVWTIIPTLILLLIATPSFALIYALDEIVEPELTIRVVGRQWYWTYEFPDSVTFSLPGGRYYRQLISETLTHTDLGIYKKDYWRSTFSFELQVSRHWNNPDRMWFGKYLPPCKDRFFGGLSFKGKLMKKLDVDSLPLIYKKGVLQPVLDYRVFCKHFYHFNQLELLERYRKMINYDETNKMADEFMPGHTPWGVYMPDQRYIFPHKLHQLGFAQAFSASLLFTKWLQLKEGMAGLTIPGFSFNSYIVATEDLFPGSFRLLEVDRRLVLPFATNIRVLVTSYDVIHSWTVPSFGIKVDALPGRLNEYYLNVNYLGLFYGQCSEICGVNHGFMPIKVEITTDDQFKWWFLRTSLLENNALKFRHIFDRIQLNPQNKLEIFTQKLVSAGHKDAETLREQLMDIEEYWAHIGRTKWDEDDVEVGKVSSTKN